MKRFFWLCVLVPCLAWSAENLIEVNMEGSSKLEQEPAARAQITREVLEKTAQKYILDLIGEKKFVANKSSVQSLVKQSNKFIPFVKGGELKKDVDHFTMAVNLKVSLDELREMLTKEGLLYETESGAVALPMIQLIDQTKGVHYSWWAHGGDPSLSFLVSLEKKLEGSLRTEFGKKGFFVLKPASSNLYEMVPSSLRIESPRMEDVAPLAEFLKANMILIGQISLEASTRQSGGVKVILKVAAHQAQSGRFVAEVARSVELEPGSVQMNANKKLPMAFDELGRDLSAQVSDAWKRGTFGSELLKLSVNGRMDSKQVDAFKASLAKSIPQVRNVRERLFEPGRVVFEVDASGSAADLANRLKSSPLEGFSLQVSEVAAGQVSIDIKTR